MFAAERGRLRVAAQRVDELVRRAAAGLVRRAERASQAEGRLRERLSAFRLDRQLAERHERVSRERQRLAAAARTGLERRRAGLGRLAASLEGLSPLAVLGRGYAVAFDGAGRALREAASVAPGDHVRVLLQRGALSATVDATETNTGENE